MSTTIHPVSSDPRVATINEKRARYAKEHLRLSEIERSLLQRLSSNGAAPENPVAVAIAAADAILAGNDPVDGSRQALGEELRETRGRIAVLARAMTATDQELDAAKVMASRDLQLRMKSELDGLARRMRDGIAEYLEAARDLLEVTGNVERAGYELRFDVEQFYVPGGYLLHEALADQEKWLRQRGASLREREQVKSVRQRAHA